MYTWNLKTGHLDRLSSFLGQDVAGWVLTPGRWLQYKATSLWERYAYLVDVRQENEELAHSVRVLERDLLRAQEKARLADRLLPLLFFSPEPSWGKKGCRVIGQKLGPNAVLETLLIDLGTAHGIAAGDPVLAPNGLVGRVLKPGLHFSTVLLLTDASSKVPVITSDGRVPAILQGQGADAPLLAHFISRKDSVAQGELLLTSGLGGVFPKGIPVARVVEVAPSEVSLFQNVYADPLLHLASYEELLVLSRLAVQENATQSRENNASVPETH